MQYIIKKTTTGWLLFHLFPLLLWSPGCPGIHYVYQAGLEFTETEIQPPLLLSARIKGLCHHVLPCYRLRVVFEPKIPTRITL